MHAQCFFFLLIKKIATAAIASLDLLILEFLKFYIISKITICENTTSRTKINGITMVLAFISTTSNRSRVSTCHGQRAFKIYQIFESSHFIREGASPN
jgi:hypothetical protein